MTSERSEQPREFSLWSFLRSVLSQGADIYLDRHGKGYELYSARLDEAAREREEELARRLQPARVPEGHPVWLVMNGGEVLKTASRHAGETEEAALKRLVIFGAIRSVKQAKRQGYSVHAGTALLSAAPAPEAVITQGVAAHIKERIDSLSPANNLSRFLDHSAPPPAEPGRPAPDMSKSWPERDYMCVCSQCGAQFIGWKRQAVCRGCQPGDGGREGVEAWLDRDWPLWRNDPSNPNVARIRRAWEEARRLACAPQPVKQESTGTVADYPDEDLLGRAVRNTAGRAKKGTPGWVAIRDVFGLGSTYSAQLCRRFGIDPETGQRTQRGGEGA